MITTGFGKTSTNWLHSSEPLIPRASAGSVTMWLARTGLILANKEFVIVHGRFSGTGRPANWIAADIVRIVDGVLAEHWDVLQDEATEEESRSGRPMFG